MGVTKSSCLLVLSKSLGKEKERYFVIRKEPTRIGGGEASHWSPSLFPFIGPFTVVASGPGASERAVSLPSGGNAMYFLCSA